MAAIGNGLSVGCVVQNDAKEFGQLIDWSPATPETCTVALVSGTTYEAEVASLKVVTDPGFDALVGPRLNMGFLAEEISSCLFSKGHCVLKVCQDANAVADAMTAVKELHEDGTLERLPAEVEEGWLGFGGKGRVKWLEDDEEIDPTIKANDQFLSSLIYSMLPYSSDVLGGLAEERTPALVSLSLTDETSAEYPSPFSDDKALGTYLNTYNRSLLKAVHWMGPASTIYSLSSKEDASLPCPPDGSKKEASANTILLYNPKCCDLSVVTKDECLSLNVTFMQADQRPQIVGRWDAADSLNFSSMEGPKLTNLNKNCVHNMATRLPAGWDDAEFYRAGLAGGCDAGVEFQKSRFDWEEYWAEDPTTAPPYMLCMKHMGFCDGLELFDNKYFNIPANEASGMDSMQRHLLETGAMNLYQMGITKKMSDRQPHHGGCAVGLDKDDWTVLEATDDQLSGNRSVSPNVQAIISNRFSFVFNLRGINYVADTACSASLCATHMARQMMMDRTNDKIEFFLCMGLHQCLNVGLWVGAHLGHMFSTVGRCTTFSSSADGYMRGDGCSGIALKWATETDEYLGIWRGSAAGQNGRSASLTAPNGIAQEDCILKAMVDADSTKPGETAIWSCHGTGTSLGDPIEIGAVRKIQKKGGDRLNKLIVNTNKTNIGHLEGGAAMTSLISAIWQMRQAKANPVNHLGILNPHLEGTEFDGWFCNELSPVRTYETQVQVSSFGFGGTNAHAVLHGMDVNHLEAAPSKKFMQRLAMMAPPEVKPVGKDPANWVSDGLDAVTKAGEVYSVTITKDDPVDKPAKYVLEEEMPAADFDKNNTSYSIVGEFSNQEPLIMEDGDVPGLRTIIVEVPSSGEIDFKFVQTMEPDFVVAPSISRCRRRTAPISGPAVGLENSWLITGVPGTDMRIDLFTNGGIIAVNWLAADAL